MADEFKRIRKDKDAAMSSDEDDNDDKVFNMDEEGDPVVLVTAGNPEIDDSDNDDVEFEDAKEEEAHDKTIESTWKYKALEISKANIGGKSSHRLKELFGSVHSELGRVSETKTSNYYPNNNSQPKASILKKQTVRYLLN